jgi:hypothetical protein
MRRIISVLAVAAMLAAMALGAAGAFAKPANEPLPNTFHHYAPEAAHQAIIWSGEIDPRGNPPRVYLTPDVYTNGEQAQQKLAVAVKPDGYFVIPKGRVKNPQGGTTVKPTCVPGYTDPPLLRETNISAGRRHRILDNGTNPRTRAKMGGFLGPHPPAPSKGLEWVMTSP